MLSKASLAGSLILLAASRTGGGRSVDFGQKILAEREGAKRLLASIWATGAQETAQLSFQPSPASTTKSCTYQGGPKSHLWTCR
jgi:hypothetical protein